VAAFCEAEGVSAWALYYWRRKLQERRVGSGKSVALKRQVAGREEGFIEVGESSAGEDLAVRSRQAVGGGVELRLELGDGLVLQIRRR
jgi:transposase-like protein